MNGAGIHGIDFCICTLNRVAYLKLCVEALLPRLLTGRTMLTIVDNNSTDGTAGFVKSLAAKNPIIRYVYEPVRGLSHARNKGWRSSAFEWIYYLDDDCMVTHDLADNALALIDQPLLFDAIGGPIQPVFTDAVPDWIPEGFGHFSMPFTSLTGIEIGFIRGGNFLIRKKVLLHLEGFNPHLGVSGNTMRYGEEIELQIRMRHAGYKIGYTPALHMKHHVRTNKLHIGWMLRSEYTRRRDKMLFDPIPFPLATFYFMRTLLSRCFWGPIYLFRFIGLKSYSIQEALLDTFKPIAFRAGEWVGALKRLTQQ